MATMIVIACPICMQKIRAPESVIGRQIRCPQCKNAFNAADPNAIPAEPSPVQSRLAESPPIEEENWADEALAAPEAKKPARGNSIVDYLVFRGLVTPVIITGLFYLGAAVILLVGLVYGILAIAGMVAVHGAALLGLLSLLIAFFATIAGLILWRVVCEVLVALFRILENVKEINLQLKAKGPI
jgi:hypothetical protein